MEPQNPISVTPSQPQTNNFQIPNAPVPTKGKSKLVIILIIIGALIIVIGSSIPFILMQISLFKTKTQLGSNGSINTSDNSITIKNKNTSMTVGKEIQTPADFPSDIPQYPGSKVLQVMNYGGSLGTAVNMTVQNTDITKVIDFYKTKMIENGWIAGDSVSQQSGLMITYKKDSRQIQLVIGAGPEGVLISVSYKN